MIRKILIANRGEIAVRIQRTCQKLGIQTVAVFSEADRHAPHVLLADESVLLGPAPPRESYLRADRILEAAIQCKVDAIHPGYGFLSENADFAEQVAAAGIKFIGPRPDHIRQFGLKHTARAIAEENRIPLLSGTELLTTTEAALEAARRIGFPVMIKSTAGGGGIGMRLCANEEQLEREYESVRSLGKNNFSDDGVFIEKFIARARHIEVQVFGDGRGRVLTIGERDCSAQRRNQKVIEETPAPGIFPDTRAAMFRAASKLCGAVHYESAGTVEFLYDETSAEFYFLEVNTRLQVEHGITEMVSGIDLVEWMIRQSAGEENFLPDQLPETSGHSIQVRLYAEDPVHNFRPSAGRLDQVHFPEGPRVDHWLSDGLEVSAHYDPLLAKLMVHGPTRKDALDLMQSALQQSRMYGITTNLDYLRQVIQSSPFQSARLSTRMLGELDIQSNTIEVLTPGTQTSVQDYPGRTGYWQVGVPPSGPMDSLAFRLGNALLGNPTEAAGLEITIQGPSLRFHCDTLFCITGPGLETTLELPDDARRVDVPGWTIVLAPAGSTLRMGMVADTGCRAYLLVRGGLDVATVMGSGATFAPGNFGGHGGRNLLPGDRLNLTENAASLHAVHPNSASSDGLIDSENATNINSMKLEAISAGTFLPEALRPVYSNSQTIGVLYGPHGAPDFLQPDYIDSFFDTEFEVHYNSARTGVRLIGPKPRWARPDGGEAGLHPSNLHDNAYCVGSIDFTGDMPIILGPDGPSLGGFVCPATVVKAELWKIGQLRPGHRVRFKPVSMKTATALQTEEDQFIENVYESIAADPPDIHPTGAVSSLYDIHSIGSARDEAIVFTLNPESTEDRIVCRQSGDAAILLEFGEMVLDPALRLRAHILMQAIEDLNAAEPDSAFAQGISEVTPGIRSLQIQFDQRILPRPVLIENLHRLIREMPGPEEMSVRSRIVHMPISWDDESTRLAIQKYMQSVWKDAPWCPSNLEFIRRINGLKSVEDVYRIFFEASYLVMGLGDVYLGAPVATPVDPRHRLVTTKYNPARTWTPQNAVGIGGAYLCIYGMEGPGGYQFVGRTIQVWNTHRTTPDFSKPYLLRFFDQIRFYEVSAQELAELRRDFLYGQFALKIEDSEFSLRDYRKFLADHSESIDSFKRRQQAAFDAERERWKDLPPPPSAAEESEEASVGETLPAGIEGVYSPMRGNLWKVLVEEGQHVNAGDAVLILEAMKMEVSIEATATGTVTRIIKGSGEPVRPGEILIHISHEG
ncbi:MAG TPA: urea carboxylase [Leptospiraceae bacterium]|nr:urea carboxylase [Spirochaetaceae bacterium]HBS06236.1 urea carboxylase [Leptospiraceae bacterium]